MTTVYFSDFAVNSPSGKLTLEVSSPDNSDPRRSEVGLQGGFTFRLVESDGGRVIWTVSSQGALPCEGWVSNEGWSVVRTHGYSDAGLVVMNPKGTRVLLVNVRAERGEPLDTDDSPTAEWVDAHCQGSTAGLVWSVDSLAYFFEIDDRAWFCMRTGWGRRIAIDLEHGLRQVPPRHRARLAKDDEIGSLAWIASASNAERDAVREILERRSSPRLGAALAVVGDDRLEDMRPLLMDLADLHDAPGWTSSHAVPSWELVRSRLRMQLRWAMRRLGVTPPLPTGVSFRRADMNPREVPERSAAFGLSPVRARDLEHLRHPWDVLERVGFPDHVRADHERGTHGSSPTAWWEDWEYDMTDGADAWTIRIRWSTKKRGRVAKRIELRDAEPGWQGADRRAELFGTL